MAPERSGVGRIHDLFIPLASRMPPMTDNVTPEIHHYPSSDELPAGLKPFGIRRPLDEPTAKLFYDTFMQLKEIENVFPDDMKLEERPGLSLLSKAVVAKSASFRGSALEPLKWQLESHCRKTRHHVLPAEIVDLRFGGEGCQLNLVIACRELTQEQASVGVIAARHGIRRHLDRRQQNPRRHNELMLRLGCTARVHKLRTRKDIEHSALVALDMVYGIENGVLLDAWDFNYSSERAVKTDKYRHLRDGAA